MKYSFPNFNEKLPNIDKSFKAQAQLLPNKTIRINSGAIYYQLKELRYFNEFNTNELPFPQNGSFFILIGLDKYGIIKISKGLEHNSNPDHPLVPKDIFPICYIFIKSNDLVITNDMIIDARPQYIYGTIQFDHNDINNREEVNSHKIESITGLTSELGNKISKNYFLEKMYNLEIRKADNEGTENSIWKIQKSASGNIQNFESGIEIENGNSLNPFIKYFSNEKKWFYSNDGIVLEPFNIDFDQDLPLIKNKVENLELFNANINQSLNNYGLNFQLFTEKVIKNNEDIVDNMDEINILRGQIQNLQIIGQDIPSVNDNIVILTTKTNEIENDIGIVNNKIEKKHVNLGLIVSDININLNNETNYTINVDENTDSIINFIFNSFLENSFRSFYLLILNGGLGNLEFTVNPELSFLWKDSFPNLKHNGVDIIQFFKFGTKVIGQQL